MLTLTSPVETALHRIPAGVKLGILAGATGVLLPMRAPEPVALAVAVVAGLYLAQGWQFARIGAGYLRVLWPFVLVLLVWHGATGVIGEGILLAAKMAAAVALANLVTMTTRLDAMLAVLTWLARPFARVGLRPEVLAMSVALVIRFTPVLMAKAQGLRDAWRARSARRAGWRVLVPLVLVALDDADQVAEALRARGGI